jgi:hypothetical protein
MRNSRAIKFAVLSPFQSSRAQRGDLAVDVCRMDCFIISFLAMTALLSAQ